MLLYVTKILHNLKSYCILTYGKYVITREYVNLSWNKYYSLALLFSQPKDFVYGICA